MENKFLRIKYIYIEMWKEEKRQYRGFVKIAGEKWHPKPDKKRDNELKRSGWKVIHINKYNIQKVIDSLTR